jgi:hypothetical protein
MEPFTMFIIFPLYLDYRIAVRIMVDEVSFALRSRSFLGCRGSYCWFRSLLGGRSWALGCPAISLFLMGLKHRPPATIAIAQIGPLLTIVATDNFSHP